MEESRARALSRPSAAETKWRALDAEQRASGLAVKAFCVARGLSAASLFAWRRRLRPVAVKQPDSAAPVAFVELVSPAADVVPARPNARTPIELELRGRRRVLLLRRGFDARLLREVLAAMRGLA